MTITINKRELMEEIFTISGEYIELLKLLKATGIADTGGMAKAVIEDGLVAVDGTTEHRKRCKIRKGQVVTFDQYTIHIK